VNDSLDVLLFLGAIVGICLLVWFVWSTLARLNELENGKADKFYRYGPHFGPWGSYYKHKIETRELLGKILDRLGVGLDHEDGTPAKTVLRDNVPTKGKK
jgi:hypothetical protein